MATYEKDGQTCNGKKIMIDGRWVFNPSEQLLLDNGWTKVIPLYYQPTEEELLQQAILLEIEELKYQLLQTDYIALKYVEGYDCDTLYPNWKEDRQALRDRINELEHQ